MSMQGRSLREEAARAERLRYDHDGDDEAVENACCRHLDDRIDVNIRNGTDTVFGGQGKRYEDNLCNRESG